MIVVIGNVNKYIIDNRYSKDEEPIFMKEAKSLSDIMIFTKLVSSRNEFRRKIKEGAIQFKKRHYRIKRLKDDEMIDTNRDDWYFIVFGKRTLEVILGIQGSKNEIATEKGN